MDHKLIENLCRCMAYLTVECETVARFSTLNPAELKFQVEEAKFLVAEAGFDFNELASRH